MIFVRHGESTGNLYRRFYGQTDGALTEKGIKQAQATAQYLKNIRIDAAYASDLVRAYETGRIVAEPHGLVPVPDKDLREIYAGEWEDMEFGEILKNYPETFGVWLADIGNSRPDGGESVAELYERINNEVWRIAEGNDGKTVLIATHATPIRMLNCYWNGDGVECAQGCGWVPNASVSIVDYDTKKRTVSVEVVGEASFMGEIVTTIPNKI